MPNKMDRFIRHVLKLVREKIGRIQTKISMERFTQRSQRVLSQAQQEAVLHKHESIGPEHLLLGLMQDLGSIACHVLRHLGVTEDSVKAVLSQSPGAENLPEYPDMSPSLTTVLGMAVDEARRLGNHFIGTEHLLLGLVRQ